MKTEPKLEERLKRLYRRRTELKKLLDHELIQEALYLTEQLGPSPVPNHGLVNTARGPVAMPSPNDMAVALAAGQARGWAGAILQFRNMAVFEPLQKKKKEINPSFSEQPQPPEE